MKNFTKKITGLALTAALALSVGIAVQNVNNAYDEPIAASAEETAATTIAFKGIADENLDNGAAPTCHIIAIQVDGTAWAGSDVFINKTHGDLLSYITVNGKTIKEWNDVTYTGKAYNNQYGSYTVENEWFGAGNGNLHNAETAPIGVRMNANKIQLYIPWQFELNELGGAVRTIGISADWNYVAKNETGSYNVGQEYLWYADTNIMAGESATPYRYNYTLSTEVKDVSDQFHFVRTWDGNNAEIIQLRVNEVLWTGETINGDELNSGIIRSYWQDGVANGVMDIVDGGSGADVVSARYLRDATFLNSITLNGKTITEWNSADYSNYDFLDDYTYVDDVFGCTNGNMSKNRQLSGPLMTRVTADNTGSYVQIYIPYAFMDYVLGDINSVGIASGWSWSQSGKTYTVSEDISWELVNVTFEGATTGGGTVPTVDAGYAPNAIVTKGSKLTANTPDNRFWPEAPAATESTSYSFNGRWGTKNEAGEITEWNFETDTVNADLTLYPIFEETTREYSVTFDGANATNVAYGSKITAPAEDPEKAPTESVVYTFDGWYNGDVKWDFENDTVSGDVALVAKFVEATRQYAVMFDNGVETQKVDYNGKATKPADPVKEATEEYTYTFDGWYYTNAEGVEVKWDFESDAVTTNVQLKAKWTETAIEPEPPVSSDTASSADTDTDSASESVSGGLNFLEGCFSSVGLGVVSLLLPLAALTIVKKKED